MNLGAALFRLERPFAYLDTDNVYKEQGNQVNNGLELTAAGNVWQGLNIYSGVTFLDPKLKDTANASTGCRRAESAGQSVGGIQFAVHTGMGLQR